MAWMLIGARLCRDPTIGFNGYRDGDETVSTSECGDGLACSDCGGSCLPCSCFNGVKDSGSGETGKDCGGECGNPTSNLQFRDNLHTLSPTRGTCSASGTHCLTDGHCPGAETCERVASRCDDGCPSQFRGTPDCNESAALHSYGLDSHCR